MPLTRRHALTALGSLPILTAEPVLSQEAVAPAPTPDQALDSAFTQHQPPALAGGIVTREGGLLWSGVRGVRRLGADAAATVEDRWHIGSNTKAMTAAAHARLVEMERVGWDTPFKDLFPELPASAAWADITVETLTNHRAGLSDDQRLSRDIRVAARTDTRELITQRLDIVRAALASDPTGTPGSFAYANVNFVLVGAAIERLTGQPWETALGALVFAPLGIADYGFGAPTGDQPWGHQLQGDTLVPLDPALMPDNPPLMGPAGTVNITIADYAKWLRPFLDDGGDLLPPSVFERLLTPLPGPGRPYAGGWAFLEGQAGAVGTLLVHEGSNTLWHTTTLVDPDGERAVFAVSNDDSRGGAATQRLAVALLALRA